MKISELLPHKAVQAAEKAEQQTSTREDGTNIAENFKRHLEQSKTQAVAGGLDPMQARNNRDDDSFRNNMDRDATLKAQEHGEEYRPDESRHRDDDSARNRRDDGPAQREDRTEKEPIARDKTEDSRNTDASDSDNTNTSDKTADDSGQDTTQDDGGNETADQSGKEEQANSGDSKNTEGENQNPAAGQQQTDSGPQIETVAAGTGVQAAVAGQQAQTGQQAQQAAASDLLTAGKADKKAADPAVMQQQVMAGKADPNAQAAAEGGDKQLSRSALAQAVRNQVQGQAAQGEQGLTGQQQGDGGDTDLQSLTQRSLAAEKGKAQQGATQTSQQNKPADNLAQQANAQVVAQKVDTAMERLADAGRATSSVRSGGQEMSQAQASNQTQSNIAASATGQQSVDSAAKVVTLSTPRGAAHMPPTQQVAIHIAKGLEAGANKININLKPAELGRVEVQLEIAKDGAVAVRVTADRQETLDLLKQDSSTLEEALKDAGLDLNEEDMEFNLREDREGELAKEEAGEGEGEENDATAQDSPDGKELSPEETQAAIRQAILDRALDITV